MDSASMIDLAADLKRLVDAGEYNKSTDLDEQDFDPKAYLEQMVAFLDFWGKKDCRVVPVFLDALEEEMEAEHEHEQD